MSELWWSYASGFEGAPTGRVADRPPAHGMEGGGSSSYTKASTAVLSPGLCLLGPQEPFGAVCGQYR